MRALRRVLLGLLAIAAGVCPAWAEKRVALVIGNSAYRNATALSNPANDAADIAAALKAWGFQVILGLDLDKPGLESKVREFSNALSESDTGVFFYAGHGLQVNGVNYLVPVDAKLGSERDLAFEGTRIDFVLQQMEMGREDKTNIVFLDACRDNPLARNLARSMGTRSAAVGNGLAQLNAGVGTFISFSTQPGNVALDGSGRNSPFTAALKARIAEPGRSLNAIMINVRKDVLSKTSGKQVPWDHSALTGDYYFDLAAAGQGLAKPQAAPEDQTAMRSRVERLETELKEREAAQKAAKLDQMRDKAKELELAIREDRQKSFDLTRESMDTTDQRKRMQITRESMDLQRKIGRRSAELRDLNERIAELEGQGKAAADPKAPAAADAKPAQ